MTRSDSQLSCHLTYESSDHGELRYTAELLSHVIMYAVLVVVLYFSYLICILLHSLSFVRYVFFIIFTINSYLFTIRRVP